MTNKFVREDVKDTIKGFASKEEQYESWFVQEKLISNPGEDYCLLFDDLRIEEYVYAKDNYMTKVENNELKKLIDLLNIYGNKHRNDNGFLDFDTSEVYNDPEWEKIREQATILYELLEKEEGLEKLKLVEDWYL